MRDTLNVGCYIAATGRQKRRVLVLSDERRQAIGRRHSRLPQFGVWFRSWGCILLISCGRFFEPRLGREKAGDEVHLLGDERLWRQTVPSVPPPGVRLRIWAGPVNVRVLCHPYRDAACAYRLSNFE